MNKQAPSNTKNTPRLDPVENLDPDFVSRKLKELSTLAEINKEIHSTVRVDGLLQILVEKAVIGVNFERGLVYLLEGDFLRCVAFLDHSKREKASLVKKRIGFRMDEKSLEVLSIKMGKPLYVENTQTDSRISKKFLKVSDAREYCVVPLIGRRETLGVFTGDKFYSRQPILPEDIETLRLFAEHISLAIENAKLYEEKEQLSLLLEKKVAARTLELSRSNQELSTLYEMSQLLNKSLDVDAVSSQILSLIQRLGYPMCSIHLITKSGHSVFQMGLDRKFEQLSFEKTFQKIFKENGFVPVPMVVDQSQPGSLNRGLGSYLEGKGIQSLFLLPLVSKEATLAAIGVYSRDQINWGEKERFFAAFSRQAGVALENALIFRHMRDEKDHVESMSRRLEKENLYLKKKIQSRLSDDFVIGKSHNMMRLIELINKVAPTDTTVTVYGETGTGKELVAQAIHKLSGRKKGPLVAVNCAAIPEDLIESELFGHEKGAFTGAHEKRVGMFELAQEGSIFLDEIGELSLRTQSKLLRVLQKQEIQCLGSKAPYPVDVRVIAATNKVLLEKVREGTFRADLYYRLNVFPLTIPPLRERREDIKTLADFFLNKCNWTRKRSATLSPEVLEFFQSYNWPGNVRELENIIERLLIVAPNRPFRKEDLPKEILRDSYATGDHPLMPLSEAIIDLKKNLVAQALKKSKGKKATAARMLGLPPSNFSRLMKQLNQ